MAKKTAKTKPNDTEINLSFSAGSFSDLKKNTKTLVPLLCFFALVLTSANPWLTEGMIHDSIPALVLLAAIAAFGIRDSERGGWSYAVPILLLMTFVLSWHANDTGNILRYDHAIFAVSAAVFAFFAALGFEGYLDAELSLVLALLVSTLIIHMAPARDDYLAALDPYWQYKWMRGIYETGYPAEHDPLVYPLIGGLAHHNDPEYLKGRPTTFGLDQSKTAMLTPISYASIALLIEPFGFTLHDVAMLFPGVISALAVVVMYLLVKEIFYEMRPYNTIAGFTAAFILMLSPAFAMKAVATNSEDDALGMFLMIAGLFLFFASLNRKKISYSVYCGLTFLLLRMGWGGSYYAFMTIGIFATLYAVIRFAHDKNTLEHLPYILIPTIIYQFMGLIVHARGGAPIIHEMPPNALYPLLTAFGASIVFEMIRVLFKGKREVREDGGLHNRIISLLEKNVVVLGVAALIFACVFSIIYRSPLDMVDWITSTIISPSVKSVVHQTVSEQNPLGTSLSSFFDGAYNRYGIAIYYGILMIPILGYYAFNKANVGSLFLLTWSVPMMYGVYYKSAWVFASSAAITALGASIGLLAAVNRQDMQSWRIIGVVLLVVVPLAYVPFAGSSNFSKFVGYQVMHMGPSADRSMWDPALRYHRDHTNASDAIVTWWDYGHWFTSVSQRPVLIDNLQADYHEIQDVARFFVNKTTEEDAADILRAYDKAYKENRGWGIKYVTIDWTMIGKSSALHYIATGGIENRSPGNWGHYIQCSYVPEASSPTEQVKVMEDGSFKKSMSLVFGCNNGYGLVFEVTEGQLDNIKVITPYRQLVNWETFRDANDVSILGVQPLVGINENRVPPILSCVSGNVPAQLVNVCRLPQFRTLVWVPQEFNDFMMTRLYLGKYLNEYKQLGLYNRNITKLKYFREIPDENGDGFSDGDFTLGFVRSYEVNLDGF